MSTLTSADFGELKRPTTRVHAPPGGGSSWSIGGDEPAAQSRGGKRFGGSFPQSQAADVHMEAPAAAAVVPAHTPAVTHAAGALRVALVKTKADAEVVDAMVQNAWEKLKLNPSVSSETFTVANLEELPYAANKLTEFGGFDAVIAFGFLNASHPLFNVLATTLTKAFIDISVKNHKPVIRGLFIGEPRVASVKAKSGYGAEFAEGIDALIRLGN